MKWQVMTLMAALSSSSSFGFFIDGDGHYGMKGETRTSPGFSRDSGTFQALQQTFRLRGEARLNDRSSAFLEFRLFPDERSAYLGDEAKPRKCQHRYDSSERERASDDTDCEGRHQDTAEPRYKDYTPQIRKAYLQYAFENCLVKAGRRGRDWGLGIFLDSGEDPFEYDASVFDGINCDINIQKSQTLGFSIGFDKLTESGTYIVDPRDSKSSGDENVVGTRSRGFGSNDGSDDIDQFYFTIEYDDRIANAGAGMTKQVGVYFSQISSKDIPNDEDEVAAGKGGSNTDLKFMDLYTGFYFGSFAIRNEFLFRMGKSADPNWSRLGGNYGTYNAPETNKLQSIGFAGNIEWTLSQSGSFMGPKKYNKGTASRHLLKLEYAYAPGDKDGYYDLPESGVIPTAAERSKYPYLTNPDGSDPGRDNKVEAIAFHANFKPALIFFNGRPEQDHMRRDGVFDPERVVNASVFALAYGFESLEGGNFEVKLITGYLNNGPPSEVKDFYENKAKTGDNGEDADSGNRPAGFHGLDLGYELDLQYKYLVGNEVEVGLASAYARPGDAWKTTKSDPADNMLIQSSITFKF